MQATIWRFTLQGAANTGGRTNEEEEAVAQEVLMEMMEDQAGQKAILH